MKQQLNPITEKKVKEIADFLFRNDYPRMGIIHVFDKFGGDKTTCEALAILCSGNMIRVDKSLGDSAYLTSIQLLDDRGQDIRHEVCDTYPNSDTFGNWFYETLRPSETCFEEHNKLGLWDYDCKKCQLEKASWMCVSHNQSMSTCQECRQTTLKFNESMKEGNMSTDDFIKILMSEHKNYLIKRKGLELEKPVYETAIKGN